MPADSEETKLLREEGQLLELGLHARQPVLLLGGVGVPRELHGEVDPLDVVKWKDLYDYIEEAIDGCEDVGNTLERIVLKNG